MTRIRRSFKPKRVVPMGKELAEFIPQFMAANLGATLILRDGRPLEWNEIGGGELAKELALWRVALMFGYVFDLDPVLEALCGVKRMD